MHLNTFLSQIFLATRQRANGSYCKGAYKTMRGVEPRIEHAPTYHVIIIAINFMNSNLIVVPWVWHFSACMLFYNVRLWLAW